MKVSIITVCFNSEKTIQDTIESVLNQDYSDIEYIVVDGASNDRTLKILDECKEKITKIISEPDQGIYDAMNKGIRSASGDLIGVLNSDDLYSDTDVVSDIVKTCKDTGSDSIYADLSIVSREDINKTNRYYSSKNFTTSKIRWGWMLPHPTFFVKKKKYEELGLYKTDYRVAADFELITRFLVYGEITHTRLHRSIIKMREGGISSNGIWWRFHQNLEIVRACRENNIYTNIAMVSLKLPLKMLEYLIKNPR